MADSLFTIETNDPQESLAFLKMVPGFLNLSEQLQADLASLMQKQKWNTDSVIFQEGDKADALYIISEGQIGVYKDGQEVAAFSRGITFGEIGILDDRPRTATIKTKSSCTLYVIPAELIKDTVLASYEFETFFDRLINERLGGSNL